MTELATPIKVASGEIIAIHVSADEFLRLYMDTHTEWVEGTVFKLTPTSLHHDTLAIYLRKLLDAYFERNPIGQAINSPFMMRLEHSFREPDLLVVLNTNPNKLTDTAMMGAADICIEIVSLESEARDYGEKYVEYRRAGVQEYWIIDPLLQKARFHRLEMDGKDYTIVDADEEGIYRTTLLPKFALHVPTLWQDKLPGHSAIGEMINSMFKDTD